MPIQSNLLAPDFDLPDQNGMRRRLSEYRGAPVVLYFYPKDDTPGCTVEACNFRDDYSAYQEAGVVILGISPDNSKQHTKFIDKFDLPFLLLADENHAVCELYGVWGPKNFMGRDYDGVYRTTYLIDESGVILKVYENVKPDQHSAEILSDISVMRS